MNPIWQSFLEKNSAVIASNTVVDYGNALAELEATASNQSIWCDLSHTRLFKVSGDDAETFLQGQLTNDIRNADTEHHQLSAHCNPKGRMMFMMRIFARNDGYYLSIPQELAENALKRLRMFVLMSKVTIDEVTDQWLHFGMSGDNAAAVISTTITAPSPNQDETRQSEHATILTLAGTNRFELLVSDSNIALVEQLTEKAQAVGKPCWDYLDIAAGIPSLTTETVEAFVPQMTNLQVINGVSFTKGCYTGQEVVARMQYLGKLKRRMYRCHIDSATAPKAGDEIESPDSTSGQGAGKVVTVAPSPQGGYEMLAVIEVNSAEAGSASINDTTLTIKELPYSLEKE
jgi:hypothetical protein